MKSEFNEKKFLVTQIENVRYYAKYRALHELTHLFAHQEHLRFDRDVNVFVGIHHWLTDSLSENSLNIGIQTEQLIDANGQILWRHLSDASLKMACLKFDVILDFSEFNRPAYKDFDKYNRLVFGPYIFPGNKYKAKKSEVSEIYFVGVINSRRQQVVDDMSQDQTVVVINNQFGTDLNNVLSRGLAVANIHFQQGVYTEWPRLLLAYLNGKILISEELGYPLIRGKHYIGIQDAWNESDFLEIHKNIFNDFAQRYIFSDFLIAHQVLKIKLRPGEIWFLWLNTMLIHLNRLSRKITKFFRSN